LAGSPIRVQDLHPSGLFACAWHDRPVS
jgi:hypothetical protein